MPFPLPLTIRFLVNNGGNLEIEPIVAASPDGRFNIFLEADSQAGDIFSIIYRGATVGSGGLGSIGGVGLVTADEEEKPDAAFLTNGSHVLVYERVISGNREIYFRLDVKNADGTYTLGAPTRANFSGSVGEQFRPEVVGLTGGWIRGCVGRQERHDHQTATLRLSSGLPQAAFCRRRL